MAKKIVRLMMDVKSHNSCRDLFKRLESLTLPCEYIFLLINFITNSEEHFQTNADVHSKSIYYDGIKIFSNLPPDPKSLMNEKAGFKIALKRYLNTHSFYSVDEYLLFKKMTDPFKGCIKSIS
jgi:hypothetical protein